MKQDEIIALARQAGFKGCSELTWENVTCTEELEAFAKLVAEREREECARIVESNADACRSDGVAQMCLYSNVAAIRARGTHESR